MHRHSGFNALLARTAQYVEIVAGDGWKSMEPEQVVNDLAAALEMVDRCGLPFKQFQIGVGPYGEPQLLAAVARYLNSLPGPNGHQIS